MGKYYEQLTPEERAAILMMKACDCSARHMARTLHRSPSTIARELARFAAWPDRPALMVGATDEYDARAAGLRARRERLKCRRRSKLATDTVLFGVVQHFLAQGRVGRPRRSRAHSNSCGPMNLNAPSRTRASTPASTRCPKASCARI